MDVNTTRFSWLNEVPSEMQMFVKIMEFIQSLILLGSLIGMYRGIEINHPGKFFKCSSICGTLFLTTSNGLFIMVRLNEFQKFQCLKHPERKCFMRHCC